MQRRDFIKWTGVASLVLGVSTFGIETVRAGTEHKWKLVTTWPKNFPGLGTGANRLAELIGELSGGRIRVKVYGAKELLPAFEIFDAVAQGTAEMGHGAAYYWKGKSGGHPVFRHRPLRHDGPGAERLALPWGGLELWTELYARFGLVPAPAGNTGVQMGAGLTRRSRALPTLRDSKCGFQASAVRC